MRRTTLFVLFLTAVLGNPLISLAQFSTGGSGGGGGMGGQSGGGLGGSMGGGGGGLGGGLGGGGGGLGGGTGGGGMGGSAMGGTSGFGQTGGTNGQMGQQQGQGFLGRNTNQNQFLGRNTQGQGVGQGQGQAGLQGGNTGRGRAAGNRNNNANQANLNGQQQGGPANPRGTAGQLPPIRPRQKVNFQYLKPQLAMVSVKLETRLNKMSTLKGNTLSLSVEPTGELVMKGQVASASDAKLAENMARLEPGVYAVRNELTYPSADADE